MNFVVGAFYFAMAMYSVVKFYTAGSLLALFAVAIFAALFLNTVAKILKTFEEPAPRPFTLPDKIEPGFQPAPQPVAPTASMPQPPYQQAQQQIYSAPAEFAQPAQPVRTQQSDAVEAIAGAAIGGAVGFAVGGLFASTISRAGHDRAETHTVEDLESSTALTPITSDDLTPLYAGEQPAASYDAPTDFGTSGTDF